MKRGIILRSFHFKCQTFINFLCRLTFKQRYSSDTTLEKKSAFERNRTRGGTLIKPPLGIYFLLVGKQQENCSTRVPKRKTWPNAARFQTCWNYPQGGQCETIFRWTVKLFRDRKVLRSVSLKPITTNRTFMSVSSFDLIVSISMRVIKLLESERKNTSGISLYKRIIFKDIELFNQARVIWRAYEFTKCCISFINPSPTIFLSREEAEKIIPLIRAY